MAKILLPRRVVLSPEVINKLKEDYKLSENSIYEIRYWNESPRYSGVVIDTGEGREFEVYPFSYPEDQFRDVYPQGKIWTQ